MRSRDIHLLNRHARAAPPTLSLLRLSAGERLLGVSGVVIALWGLVAWAAYG